MLRGVAGQGQLIREDGLQTHLASAARPPRGPMILIS
jgi:hypothetical protein